MGKGCDCSHCPGCGDVDEPKKKVGDKTTESEDAEIPEEVDLDLEDDSFDDEDEED